MIGVHWTAVDDNGDKFGKLFDVENSWNLLPYPTQITVDRYFKYGWSAEFSASYMQYKSGRLINDSTNVSATFLNTSLSGKFSFYNMYAPRARWIDPYLTLGIGYTYRSAGSETHVPTLNAGGGVNFWVVNNFGVRLNATSNFAVYPGVWDTNANYLQYSAGLVLRFSSAKKSNGDFGRRKNKWAHGNKRYKQPKNGQ